MTDAAKADELLELNAIRERFVSKCDVFSKSLKDTPINAGSKFTVKQFSTALYLLAQSDDIEDKLKKASAEFEEAGNRKLGSEYGRIYVKIMNVLEQLCDLIPDETTDIRGFGKLLDAGLDAIRIGMIPTGMDYVQIGDLTRSRFENIKALFIVGANDGIIPKIASSPGMINENEREFLTGVDPKLVLAPTAKEDMYTQRLYIYMALNKPSDRLFVSFSRLSYGGKSLLPSYIVKKIVASDPGITIEKRPILPEYYTDEEEAFDELTDMIYPMLSGTLEKKRAERVKALMEYFLQNGKYKMRLKRLIEREILRTGSNLNDTIGSALAHAIYGKKINASITRLENYAKCAYGYFLRYGLKLKEREIFSLEARDIGNIFHDSMKEYSELMQNGGYSWRDIPDDERDSLMDRAVDHVMERYRSAKLSSSARYAYMETRIRRIMRKSAQTVCAQLKKGLFSPRYFEVDFDRIKGENTLSLTLSDDDMMRLYGRIDRIDTYESEDGIYVRIIDYKSSQHDMDLLAVYEGRQLQLLVYLNVAKEMIMKDMERDGKDLPVIPAGVLYYRMDDPMVAAKSGLTDEDIRKLIMKDLCLKGLVNKDLSVVRMMDADIQNGSTVLPVSLTTKGELRKSKSAVTKDAFDVLSCYVTERIRNMGTDILAGNIAIPEPDGNSRFTGPDCAFCPYSLICSVRGKGKSEPEEDAPEDTEETKKETSGSGDNDWITLMKKAVNNGTDEKSTNGD